MFYTSCNSVAMKLRQFSTFKLGTYRCLSQYPFECDAIFAVCFPYVPYVTSVSLLALRLAEQASDAFKKGFIYYLFHKKNIYFCS